MNEKLKLEKQVFGVAISQVTIANFTKLLEVYEEQKDKALMRKLVLNRARKLISGLDYYSLLSLQREFFNKNEEINKIFEERKVPLLKEIIKDISDPLSLKSILEKEFISSSGVSLIVRRINQVLVSNIEKISKLDDLISFYQLADSQSTAKVLLGEKIIVCLREMSYQEVLEKQKKQILISKPLDIIFEEIKLGKLREKIESFDLKKIYQLTVNEKLSSSCQEFLRDHLSELVVAKINQINDLNEIIDYWMLSHFNSKAREYLEVKFSQLLSNLSYQELVDLGKKRLRFHDSLKVLLEKRQEEMIPERLKELKTPNAVLADMYNTDTNSRIWPYLLTRLLELVEEKFDKIDKFSDLSLYFNLSSEKPELQNRFLEKIKKKLAEVDNFSLLHKYYQNAIFNTVVEDLIKEKIIALLEANKNDKALIKAFVKEIGDKEYIPESFRDKVKEYL